MKQYIIAVFLTGLSCSGFGMNESIEDLYKQYPYLESEFNAIKTKTGEKFLDGLIVLLIKSPSGNILKEIKISKLSLAIHSKYFAKIIKQQVNKDKSRKEDIAIEESEYPYFYILLHLIHDIDQVENVQGWTLQDLENFLNLARKLDCIQTYDAEIIDGNEVLNPVRIEPIYNLVKNRTKNLSLKDINIMLAKLPPEVSIEKAISQGVKNFSRRNYESFEKLPDSFREFPFLLVYYILNNPDFKVKKEDDFAELILQWLNDKTSELSEENIKNLFNLIRYPFLSNDFVENKLEPFIYKSGRTASLILFNDFALECLTVVKMNNKEKLLQLICDRMGMKRNLITARESYSNN